MPSSELLFVRRILVGCICAAVLASSASSVLAAPADSVDAESVVAPSNSEEVESVEATINSSAGESEATPGAEVADLAEHYVGSPYRWGGASPAGFDCTGFVMWVYGQFGVSMPHNEAGQLASGDRVSVDELEPGDVLVFANTYRRGLSHAGIYVGNGQFVHAADERHGVMISSLSNSYWGSHFAGASRAIA